MVVEEVGRVVVFASFFEETSLLLRFFQSFLNRIESAVLKFSAIQEPT